MNFFPGRILLILALPLCTLFTAPAVAQKDGDEVKIGTWQSIESKVLGETRRIIVSRPSDYDSTDNRYAVLYLLDGTAHFHHTTGLIEFMRMNQEIPGIIVVAVTNTDRTRDLTPQPEKADPTFPTAGGADNFAKFFREELIPYIDENYRTRSYRILVGHSFGGLFAVHTLVHHDDLFNAYLAISPSFQWDDQRLVDQAESFFHGKSELRRSLYMTMGNEGGKLLGGVLKVAGALEEKSPRGFEWDSRVMEEETHGSVPYRSTRQGLEFIFKGWSLKNPMELYEVGGVSAIHKHFEKSSAKFGIERKTPQSVLVMLTVGLNSSGRMEEARQVLEHDQKNYPPPAMLYSMIGKNFVENGDNEQAIACYKRALEINPAASDAKRALQDLGVDVAALVKSVTVSEDLLAEYAGKYTFPVGESSVEVTMEDGKLFSLAIGVPKAELTAVSENTFVEASGIYKVSFERDDTESVHQLTLHVVNGTEYVCPRATNETSDKD